MGNAAARQRMAVGDVAAEPVVLRPDGVCLAGSLYRPAGHGGTGLPPISASPSPPCPQGDSHDHHH